MKNRLNWSSLFQYVYKILSPFLCLRCEMSYLPGVRFATISWMLSVAAIFERLDSNTYAMLVLFTWQTDNNYAESKRPVDRLKREFSRYRDNAVNITSVLISLLFLRVHNHSNCHGFFSFLLLHHMVRYITFYGLSSHFITRLSVLTTSSSNFLLQFVYPAELHID